MKSRTRTAAFVESKKAGQIGIGSAIFPNFSNDNKGQHMRFEDIPKQLSSLLEAQHETTLAIHRLADAITNRPQAPAAGEPKNGRNKAAAAPQSLPQSNAVGVEPELVKSVTDAIVKLAGTKGRIKAVEVLNRFNANTVPELKPEQYAEVLKAAREALEVA